MLANKKSGGFHVPRHKDIILPTTITGRCRARAGTENLGTGISSGEVWRFREQYEDALTCFIRDQGLAGLEHRHRWRLP
jgi:hypothetical protein